MSPDFIEHHAASYYRAGMTRAEFKAATKEAVRASLESAARIVHQQGLLQEERSYERRLLMGLSKAITARARPFNACQASKLTSRDVAQIRKLRQMSVKVATIAAQFQVAESTVYDILAGNTWAKL